MRSLLNQLASVRQGAYLPHWSLDGAIYHVVFRLDDALPAQVVRAYQLERDALFAEASTPPSPDVRDRLDHLFSERIEQHLDKGQGACWLVRTEIAEIVANALRHFDGSRYGLLAWCVMPNHVHVVLNPSASYGLSEILHSWKSFTAKEANASLGRTGPFWQKESYDHIVRDDEELARTIRYVGENPSKAGLRNWRWVWPEMKGS